MPRVSVVIPCRNGAGLLGTAIRSALAQTMGDLEIVVADDGSSDGTAEVAESFGAPVRVIRVAYANVSETRNAAIAAGDSELVGFLDHDDAWRPEKLERQIARLDADPRLGLCWTDTRILDAQGRELPERHNPMSIPRDWTEGLGRLLAINLAATSSVLVRRSALESAGAFDPAYRHGEDWDLWLRLAEERPLAALPEVLVDYCWHAGNASRQRIPMLRGAIAVQESALARIARHPRWAREPALGPYLAAARRKLASRWSELGTLQSRAGRRQEALSSIARGLSIDPWRARFWTRLVRAWARRGAAPSAETPR